MMRGSGAFLVLVLLSLFVGELEGLGQNAPPSPTPVVTPPATAAPARSSGSGRPRRGSGSHPPFNGGEPVNLYRSGADTQDRARELHFDQVGGEAASIPEVLNSFYQEGSSGTPLDFQCGGFETMLGNSEFQGTRGGNQRICDPASFANAVCSQQNMREGEAYQQWLYQIAMTKTSLKHAPRGQNEDGNDPCNIGRMCLGVFDRTTMRCTSAAFDVANRGRLSASAAAAQRRGGIEVRNLPADVPLSIGARPAESDSTPAACRLPTGELEKCNTCRDLWSRALHGFHRENEFHHHMREELAPQYAAARTLFSNLKQSMIASLRGTELVNQNGVMRAAECPPPPAAPAATGENAAPAAEASAVARATARGATSPAERAAVAPRCGNNEGLASVITPELERAINEAEFAVPNNTHCIGQDDNVFVVRRPGGRIVVYACPRALLTMGDQSTRALDTGGIGQSRLALQLSRALGHALDSCSLEHRQINLPVPGATADSARVNTAFNLGSFNHPLRACLAENYLRTPQWAGRRTPASYVGLAGGSLEMSEPGGEEIDPMRRFRLIRSVPSVPFTAPTNGATVPNHCSSPRNLSDISGAQGGNQTNALEAQTWGSKAFGNWAAQANYQQSLSERHAAVGDQAAGNLTAAREASLRASGWFMNNTEIASWNHFCEDYNSARGTQAIVACQRRVNNSANQSKLKLALTFRPYCLNMRSSSRGGLSTTSVPDGQEMFQLMIRDPSMRSVLGCRPNGPGRLGVEDPMNMFGPPGVANNGNAGSRKCDLGGEHGFFEQGMRAVASYHLPPAPDAGTAPAAEVNSSGEPSPTLPVAQQIAAARAPEAQTTQAVTPGTGTAAPPGAQNVQVNRQNTAAAEADPNATVNPDGTVASATPGTGAEPTATTANDSTPRARLAARRTILASQRQAANQVFNFQSRSAANSANVANSSTAIGIRHTLANPACANLPLNQSCSYQYLFDHNGEPVVRIAQNAADADGNVCTNAQGCLCFNASFTTAMPTCARVEGEDLTRIGRSNMIADPGQSSENNIYRQLAVPITNRVFALPRHSSGGIDSSSNSRRVLGRALGITNVPHIVSRGNPPAPAVDRRRELIVAPDYCYGRPGAENGSLFDTAVDPEQVGSPARRCTARDLWSVVSDGTNVLRTRPLFDQEATARLTEAQLREYQRYLNELMYTNRYEATDEQTFERLNYPD